MSWNEYDSDGLPITPDYASHYRALPHIRQQQPAPHRQAPRPAPTPDREFTQRDIEQFERAEDWQYLRRTAHDIHNQEVRIKQVEQLMKRDINAYYESPWHDWYSEKTGSVADSKQRTR